MKNLVNNLVLVTTLGASILLAGCPGSGGSGGGSSAAPAAAPSTATASGTTTAETAITAAASTTTTATKTPIVATVAETLDLTVDQNSITFPVAVRSSTSKAKFNIQANIDVPAVEVALSSGAEWFSISQNCTKMTKNTACPVEITAGSSAATGLASGTLTVSVGGKVLKSVALSVSVTQKAVKKLASSNNGFGVVWADGTANFWGQVPKSTTFAGAKRAFPNTTYASTLSASTLDSASSNPLVTALPVVLPSGAKVADMEWEGRIGCALGTDGSYSCWGQPTAVSSVTVTAQSTTPQTITASGVTSIGAANDMHCYLDSTSHAWCVGRIIDGTGATFTDVNPAGNEWTNIPRAFASGYRFDYLTVSNSTMLCGKVLSQDVVVCAGVGYSSEVLYSGDLSHEYPATVLDNTRYAVSGSIRGVAVGNSGNSNYVCILSDRVGCTGGGSALGFTNGVFCQQYQPALTYGGTPVANVAAIFPTYSGLGMTTLSGTYVVGRSDLTVGGTLAAVSPSTGYLLMFSQGSTAQVGEFDLKATQAAYGATTTYTTITAYDSPTCTNSVTGVACD